MKPHTPYINVNGVFHPQDATVFKSKNRSFRYGDCLFETIHAIGSRIQFFEQHYDRLIRGMTVLNMDIPSHFKELLEKYITDTINKNRYFGGNRIRLSVFRDSDGLYTPKSNQVAFLIEVFPLDTKQYMLNDKGWNIGIYKEIYKQKTPYSSFKTANSMLYIMAANYNQTHHFDDCLLVDSEGYLMEGISSNLFVVTKDTLQTPALSTGIVEGVMRQQIIEIASANNYIVFDDCLISEADLLQADEIFLTNAIHGIRWVSAYKQRRYFNKVAKELTQYLNTAIE